ncbi:MAG: PKD domain-containing protein [Candidatus Bathyarchaeia archaeon]
MQINLWGLKHFKKVSFASLIMIPLIFMFLMAMLPFSTANGAVPEMKAPGPGTIPTIDGIWSSGEWDDALEYSATNSTLTSYVRVKWYGSFLYILIDSPWDTTNSSVYPYDSTWIAFDTLHNHGSVPQTDDYLLLSSSMWAFTGDGSQWKQMAVPSGFRFQSSSSDEYGPGALQPSPKNATPHRIDEFRVPLTYVGQINQTGGFYFMVIDDIDDPDGTGPKGSPTYVEWPENSGGSSDGWPPDGRDPCPTPSDWGHLTFLQRPTAAFTHSPDIPDVNETVTFDASDSQDPEGSIVNYTWDFDDGNVTTVNATTITHTFSVGGPYDVNLTVTDNDGLNDSVVQVVSVGVPRAAFTFLPPAPNVNETVTFDALTSRPRWNGTAYVPIVNYTWDFDDGNVTTVNATTITHIFSAGGSYDVNLTVTDDTGLNGSVVHTVNVGAPRANFTFWPSAPNQGDVVIFNASASYDPDGGNITSYTWNWGDSTSNVTTNKVITHTFSMAGNYKVNLTVTDDLGLKGSFTHNVTVYAPREAHFSFSPPTPNVGDAVTFNASLSKDPGGTIVNYTWNFDDGSDIITVNTTVITHTFSANGSYNVNLTITDNDGLKSWYNNTVNVGIPPFQVTAPFSPIIPTIDGIWNPGEWDDAQEYEVTGPGGTSYLRIKHNSTHLHILIDSPWDTTNATWGSFENAFIVFDTEHDKSTVGPQPDDYLFNNGYSVWMNAWQGNGIKWISLSPIDINYVEMGYNATQWSGASPKNATIHRTDEFRIPLAFVGNSTSGFYVMVVDDSSDPDGWGLNDPPTAWVEWPSGTGGDPRGWPMGADYIDPCPTPDKWGYLILEPSMKALSNITLDISSSSITLGENVTISGTVFKSTGAIAGVDVTIQYKSTGATAWTNATTVTTDSTGSYTYTWTPTEAGTYEIKASWAGDADTYGAESEAETLEVAPKQEEPSPIPILEIVAVLAVVAVVAAIAVYLLKVRKPKQ